MQYNIIKHHSLSDICIGPSRSYFLCISHDPPSAPLDVVPTDPVGTESSPVVKSCSPCVSPSPEPQKVLDIPVGSQKRKARKSKITHLVRTADGRVSPAEGELPVTTSY